ncbi:MAG: gentisate 1,2-dioxygenase [Burkholderiales bacterium]|nr:gentisate 1,2-dioxygenase [Burkholderiales bacterium]
MFAKPTSTAERAAFYQRIDKESLTPLWEVLGALVIPEPKSECVPAHWRYATVREHLMEAGRLISAEEAERRVLVLENPGIRGRSSITHTLYCGLQLILPGEVAPSHRHTQSALRFVVEGEGAFTAVDGERATMHPGDFIITPSGAWHDHGNPGGEPVIWMDGLDIPLVRMLDASFAERYPEKTQPVSRPEGDALARYGMSLLPVNYEAHSRTSPLFVYPYGRTREALDTLFRHGPVHAAHGARVQYVNPATGGFAMPTIATFIQFLPKGFRGDASRATDGTIYCVVEGSGRTKVGDAVFDWTPRDIFVAPSWLPVRHEAASDAVLFSYSDRPVQQALGLWREETGSGFRPFT